jgi:hypothetical protein
MAGCQLDDMVALGRVVLSRREHVIVLEPKGRGLGRHKVVREMVVKFDLLGRGASPRRRFLDSATTTVTMV